MEVLHSWLVRMLHMHEVIGSSPITSTKKEKYAPGRLFRVRVFCLQRLFRLESKIEIAFTFCKIEYAIKNGFRLDISRNLFLSFNFSYFVAFLW